MALRITLSVLLGSLFFFTPPLQAQESVQAALFDNCEEARRAFVELPTQEKEKTFDFLTRVIALNTQAPSAPEAFAVLPGSQTGTTQGPAKPQGLEVLSGQLWQSTDAKRELRAKRCALEILLSAGASALSTLPKLVSIYSEQPLSDEIAVSLEETAAGIAEIAHKAGATPSEADIDFVIGYVGKERSLVARNFLAEYPIVAVPRVLLFVSRSTSKDTAALSAEALADLDPDGRRSLRAFIDLTSQLTPQELEALASHLKVPAPEIIRHYLQDLIRLQTDSTRTTALTPLMGRICIVLDGLPVDATSTATLARLLQPITDERLTLEEKKCLIGRVPQLAERTALAILASDESTILQALIFLPAITSNLLGESRSTIVARLRELALSRSERVAPAAIEALALFSDKKHESLSVLAAITQPPSPRKKQAQSIPVPPGVISAAFKSASALVVGKKEAPLFIPAIIKAAQTGVAFNEARTLAQTLPPSFESDLLALLPSSSLEGTARVLQLLEDRTTLSTKAATVLLELVKNGSPIKQILPAMTRVSSPNLAAIRKAMPRSASPKKLPYLTVLVARQSATRQEANEFSTLLASADCSYIAGVTIAISAFEQTKDTDAASVALVRQKVGECLPYLDDSAGLQLIDTSPQAVILSCGSLGEKLGSSQISPALTANLSDFSLEHPECATLSVAAIKNGSTETWRRLLLKASTLPALHPDLLLTIRDKILREDTDEDVYYSAALLIARHAPQLVDWKRFIRKAIDEAGHGKPIDNALTVTRYLTADTILEEVIPALNSENPERVVGACVLGSSLGTQAVPIVSTLWHLREKRTPSIRYAATLALLEINPLTPELQDALRQILVNRYFTWAVPRPIRWQQTVALVELPKSDFGTLRATHLELLLTRQHK